MSDSQEKESCEVPVQSTEVPENNEVSKEKGEIEKSYSSKWRWKSDVSFEEAMKTYVKRKRRHVYPGETEAQRAARLEAAKMRNALLLASMSESEKIQYLKRKKLLYQLRMANETPEEREERLASKRLRNRNRSPSARAATLQRQKIRYALQRANETPEERTKRNEKERLHAKARYVTNREELKERARKRFKNMSETERSRLLERRRARDAITRKRKAQERQKRQELEKLACPVLPKPPLFPPLPTSTPMHKSCMKLSLFSEITIEPDVPDYSFYNYVYNEIQPLMLQFQGNLQTANTSQNLTS